MVQATVPTMKNIITEKITHACRSRPSIRPNMRTSANGKSIIAAHERKFVVTVGFSNGCAEFMP